MKQDENGEWSQQQLRLMAMDVALAAIIKRLPAVQEELLKAALALDAPPLSVPDSHGPAIAKQLRAYAAGLPGARPEE